MSLKKLGRYDLVRVLGKGAMGIVYEGRDPNLDRRVAIKTVKVENLSEEAAAEYEHRFRTEARSAARLQHPNIVSVYDSDRDGDIAFLVMEYIQGDDLKHHLDKGVRYSLEQSLKMIRDLLSALDYAHKQGIVHRDIKPANLLIEPGGRVKLTDFGVARIQDSGEATRTQGSMVGTLKYMSPEQVQGQKIDSRADLFSVGVVLYQLLTDKRPFDGDNDFSIIHQIIGHTPAPPSSYNARLPSAIDAVVARALAKDREERFASARDFASALQSAIRRAEDATVVPPPNPLRGADGPGTGSKGPATGTGAGGTPTSGSTVTQELELVYWKDIKDSTEPDELEGFLARFPDGIYADLARRRLRKLASSPGSPDQTILSGMRAPRRPGPGSDAHALGHEPLVRRAASAATAAPAPVDQDVDGRPRAAANRRARQPTSPHRGRTPHAGVARGRRSAMPTRLPRTPPRRRHQRQRARRRPARSSRWPCSRRWAPWRSRASPHSCSWAGAPVTARRQPARRARPPRRPLQWPSATDGHRRHHGRRVLAHRRAGQRRAARGRGERGSAAASRPASAPRRAPVKKANAASAVEAPRAAVPRTRAAPRRSASPRRQPAPSPSASPVEQCRDKVFLSREFCLAEQCAKPGTRNHPLCVQRREEIRLREESKVRQGPQ